MSPLKKKKPVSTGRSVNALPTFSTKMGGGKTSFRTNGIPSRASLAFRRRLQQISKSNKCTALDDDCSKSRKVTNAQPSLRIRTHFTTVMEVYCE
ncbi:hypothetical protein AVEN_154005-1 [Araneus ventricosus]|uniref:Uncharacterized protein n=1 Tax=Araneus ventricosus TaxID=182803 RepID=A0A4Y2VL41_ARAVE|nr:hypothetical protein AVEN_154005-1 [Araneus ventricosus]